MSRLANISNLYFVYALLRPDGRPFYIGKGSGNRMDDHAKEARSGHKCPKCSVIRKIWEAGGKVQNIIIFTTDDESVAYAEEARAIARIGLANLTNLTAGGIGNTSPSDEVRAKIRAARAKQVISPEHVAKLTAGRKAKPVTDEVRARMSAAQKLAFTEPERRAKLSASRKGVKATPETRAKQSAAAKARSLTDEGKANHAKANRASHKKKED